MHVTRALGGIVHASNSVSHEIKVIVESAAGCKYIHPTIDMFNFNYITQEFCIIIACI